MKINSPAFPIPKEFLDALNFNPLISVFHVMRICTWLIIFAIPFQTKIKLQIVNFIIRTNPVSNVFLLIISKILASLLLPKIVRLQKMPSSVSLVMMDGF